MSAGQDVAALSVPQLVRNGDWLVTAWTVEAEDETGISSARIAISGLD
jgi:hypothetical protein